MGFEFYKPVQTQADNGMFTSRVAAMKAAAGQSMNGEYSEEELAEMERQGIDPNTLPPRK